MNSMNAGKRLAASLLGHRIRSLGNTTANNVSLSSTAPSGNGALWASALAGTVAVAGSVYCNDEAVAIPHYPFSHNGMLDSYDHASVRRGYQVYKQVCATCHSLKQVAFRNLVGVTHTEEQAKAIAEECEIVDGPNDEGEMFERPGKLSDYFPKPYENDNQARFANGGALPPDLSLITKARHGGENYIFGLLTGYRDAPEGVEMRDGLYYNPWMVGGAIAMPPPLQDGMVDYEDGTPATVSQMSKDVATFLAWAGEPCMEDKKKMGIKVLTFLGIMIGLAGYWKRFKFAPFKSRRVQFRERQ